MVNPQLGIIHLFFLKLIQAQHLLLHKVRFCNPRLPDLQNCFQSLCWGRITN